MFGNSIVFKGISANTFGALFLPIKQQMLNGNIQSKGLMIRLSENQQQTRAYKIASLLSEYQENELELQEEEGYYQEEAPIAQIREIPHKHWIEEQLFGSELQNKVKCILLYGLRGSGKAFLTKQIAESCSTTAIIVNPYDDWFMNSDVIVNELTRRLDEIKKKARYQDHTVLAFTNCEVVFNMERWGGSLIHVVMNFIKKSTPNPLYCIFTSKAPGMIPEEIMDICGVPVFVPPPSELERKEFFRNKIQDLRDKYHDELLDKKDTQIVTTGEDDILDDEFLTHLALSSTRSSFFRLSTYVEKVFDIGVKTRGSKLTLPRRCDFIRVASFMLQREPSYSKEEITEMISFAQKHGLGTDVFNLLYKEKLSTISHRWYPSIDTYLARRQDSKGQWQVLCSWRPHWFPVQEITGLPKSLFKSLPDTTRMEYKEREVVQLLNYLQKSQLHSDVKTGDTIGALSSGSKVTEPSTPNQKSDCSTPDNSPESGTEKVDRSPEEHNRKRKNEQVEDRQIKRGKSDSNSRLKKRWYDTYFGSLAFALFKVKTWMIKGDGRMQVSLEQKKYGGSVYDWDIIYLGMKLIYDEVVNYTCGIHAARKVIKNHPLVGPKIAEWRRTRTYVDDQLKKLFRVTSVKPQEELDQFIEDHREWKIEEENEQMELIKSKLNQPHTTNSPTVNQSSKQIMAGMCIVNPVKHTTSNTTASTSQNIEDLNILFDEE